MINSIDTTQLPQTPMPKIQVLLVEDDITLRDALSEYLELNNCKVTAVGSGMAFYHTLAKGHEFHVTVIDLGLPDQPGQVLVEYARRNTRMSIIIITANNSIENRIETYHTGADLLLGKPLDSRELLAAVVSMNRRYLERHGHDAFFRANGKDMAWQLDCARRQLITPAGVSISLSLGETNIFELFSAAGTQIVGRKQLVEQLYQRDDESTRRALDNTIRRLRQKLTESHPQPSPILTAYGVGYSFSEPLQHF